MNILHCIQIEANLQRRDGEDTVFAVIRTEPRGAEKTGAKIHGFINRTYGIHADTAKIFGTRVLECIVDIPYRMTDKKIMRRVETALRIIAGSGVRTVVCDSGFKYSGLLPRYMLTQPDRLRLLRKMSAWLALFALGPDAARKTAALYAKRLTPDFDEAVRILLPQARNLAVDCGPRRDGYASGLLSEYGISVLTNRAAFNNADVHIFFDEPAAPVYPKADSIALCFCSEPFYPGCIAVRDAEFHWPDKLGDPKDFPPQELLTALFNTGVLSEKELEVKRLIHHSMKGDPAFCGAELNFGNSRHS